VAGFGRTLPADMTELVLEAVLIPMPAPTTLKRPAPIPGNPAPMMVPLQNRQTEAGGAIRVSVRMTHP
jgi:hypothetical protein